VVPRAPLFPRPRPPPSPTLPPPAPLPPPSPPSPPPPPLRAASPASARARSAAAAVGGVGGRSARTPASDASSSADSATAVPRRNAGKSPGAATNSVGSTEPSAEPTALLSDATTVAVSRSLRGNQSAAMRAGALTNTACTSAASTCPAMASAKPPPLRGSAAAPA